MQITIPRKRLSSGIVYMLGRRYPAFRTGRFFGRSLLSLKSADDGLNVISVFFRERFSDRANLLHNRIAKHDYSSISSSGVQMIGG